MTDLNLSRRGLLAAAGLGLSVSFLGRSVQAAGDLGGRKMVVVVCRGGMDGLSVSPPIGDSAYAGLRGPIAISAADALKLDGDFGLHPALASVHAMALKGQARIAPAMAVPDRARSHFEAQDVLESGGDRVYGTTSGWLNRALQAMDPGRKVSALSVGATAPLILRGPAQAGSWSPGRSAESNPRLPQLLTDLYADDPLLGPSFAKGLEIEDMAEVATAGVPPAGQMAPAGATPAFIRQGQAAADRIGRSLAGFMVQPGGPQLAALSADGFDTHANQGAAQGQLANRLLYLDALLNGLREGLGETWSQTVVVCATEFGRTARVNGTGGTDHGTASTALVLGGALKRGGIIGDWPGLQPAALLDGRDTNPTLDSRSLFKGLLRDHMGMDLAALDRTVFPGSADARPVAGLI